MNKVILLILLLLISCASQKQERLDPKVYMTDWFERSKNIDWAEEGKIYVYFSEVYMWNAAACVGIPDKKRKVLILNKDIWKEDDDISYLKQMAFNAQEYCYSAEYQDLIQRGPIFYLITELN